MSADAPDIATAPPILPGLSALAGRYDALVCDVWGVVHNGVEAYPAAVEALTRFRAGGGAVVLVTNSPRREDGVIEQLGLLGVPRDAYDSAVTSGELTFSRLVAHGAKRVHQIGPPRDVVFYEGTDIALVAPEDAEIVVCSGIEDEDEGQPEDYRERFEAMVGRGLTMLCANPDIVVERGPRLLWCAGALARVYGDLGGKVELLGKPHQPIYDEAKRRIAALRPEARVLAVGDGLATDVRGAVDHGIDVLFVIGGIHGHEFGGIETSDPRLIAARLASEGLRATACVPMLRWG
ncbi:TIGR01459 family HAD-type hydrolase [Pseudoxanthobacter sp. M-2]|uniref:TIGR01459 family HAD-type hydrolase n=1 Tax=Pseudoxanthobacter sp. M-2 TaxID=3078754 RepID=UPI0038FC3B00